MNFTAASEATLSFGWNPSESVRQPSSSGSRGLEGGSRGGLEWSAVECSAVEWSGVEWSEERGTSSGCGTENSPKGIIRISWGTLDRCWGTLTQCWGSLDQCWGTLARCWGTLDQCWETLAQR
eukprot:3195912-Pyramimonas_sp.AAC.1